MLKVSVLTQNNNLQDDFSENLRDYLDIERINSQDCQKRTVKLLNQAYTQVYGENTLKILVSYIKPANLFKTDILTPIQLGRAVEKENSKDGVQSDENLKWLHENCMFHDDFEGGISKYNRQIGFLTGTYWAWKNYDQLGCPKYFGSFGYRKLLYPEFLDDLTKYDCVFPRKVDLGKTSKEIFIGAHGSKAYDKTMEILQKLYPDDASNFEKYMAFQKGYLLEMYVMKKEIFFDFCAWIFPIVFALLDLADDALIPDNKEEIVRFFETEDISKDCTADNFEIYQKRIRAFMIERLTGYYLYKLTQSGVKYVEQDYCPVEHIDTIDPIIRLLRLEKERGNV